MAGILPRQKLSNKEKTPEWFKNNIDFRVDQAMYYSDDRYEIIQLYKAAMGEIDATAYKYVLNPYNSTSENLRNYPAQLRNYDIITPIINLFLGEKAERPLNHQVIVINADAPSINKDNQDKEFMGVLAQRYVNALNESGVKTGVPSQEVPEFKDVLEKYKVNADDKRAIFGQEAVDYLKYTLNLKDTYQTAFYDWIVTGRCYSFKDVYKNDVQHEICPVLECWHGSTRTGFVEDAEWFVRKNRFSLSNCIDRFHEVLSSTPDNDEVKGLEDKFINGNDVSGSVLTNTPNLDNITTSGNQVGSFNPQGLIDVFHVCWKGFKEIGFLKYTDQFGIEQEMEVDEEYVLDKLHGDISIEKRWISVVYQGYRIGGIDGLYKYMEELPVQREDMNNTSLVKLPYNGRVGYSERNKINSIVKQILPYQALINIYHFRGELTLAKSKDKIMLMPIGLIPDSMGSGKDGMEQFLYFAESTGLAFFDETKPNATAVLNAIRGIDMGLGTYVSQMRELIRDIKAEAWEAIGMNRQRYGDVNSSDGKSVNEQAQLRSATISREMCRRFERFQESDMDGLLDYSRYAWVNGKKGMYINSEGQRAFLEVNPDEHLGTNYKLFINDGIEEHQKLQMAKDYSFGWAQKAGVKPSVVLEVLDANNMSKIKNFVMRSEAIQEAMENARIQSEQQNSQALQDKQDAINKAKLDTEIQKSTISADASIQVAEINAGAKASGISQQAPEDNSQEIQKDYNAYLESVRAGDLEKQKLALGSLAQAAETRLKEAELMLKDKEIKSKEKIAEGKDASAEKVASLNRNKYSK